MAFTREECNIVLEAKFRESFSQIDNVSKLTTDARGSEKYACIEEMGGMVAVNNALQQIQLNKTEVHGAPTTTPQIPQQITNETTTQQTIELPTISEGTDFFLSGAKIV